MRLRRALWALGRISETTQAQNGAPWTLHWLQPRYFSEAAEAAVDETVAEIDPKLDVIYAVPREESGRLKALKARKQARIPSIVFSQEDGHLGGHKQLLTLDLKQVTNLVKKLGQSFFMSRLYTLEIRTDPDPNDGELISRERVLPRLVHVHAVTDVILNVTFIRAPPHARLKVDIPLVFVGQDVCAGIRRGGYLNTIRRTVKYLCPPDLIPKYIEVDLSLLQVGQSILIKDLEVPAGIVVYAMDPAWPVCKIMGSRSMASDSGKK